MKNVTWQDQINDKIIDIFLPLWSDNIKNPTATRRKIVSCSVSRVIINLLYSVCVFIEDTISFLLNCVSVIVVHRLLKIT